MFRLIITILIIQLSIVELIFAGGGAVVVPPAKVIKKEPKSEYTNDRDSVTKRGTLDKNVNYTIQYDKNETVRLGFSGTDSSSNVSFEFQQLKDFSDLFQQCSSKASSITGNGLKSYKKEIGKVGDVTMSVETDSSGKVFVTGFGRLAKEDFSKFTTVLRMVPEVKGKYEQKIKAEQDADKRLEDKKDDDENKDDNEDKPKAPPIKKEPVANKIKKAEKKGSVLKDDEYFLVYDDGTISFSYSHNGKKIEKKLNESQVVNIRVNLGACLDAVMELEKNGLKDVAKEDGNTFEVRSNDSGDKTICWNDDKLTVDECKSVIKILRQVDDLKKELRTKNEALAKKVEKPEENTEQADPKENNNGVVDLTTEALYIKFCDDLATACRTDEFEKNKLWDVIKTKTYRSDFKSNKTQDKTLTFTLGEYDFNNETFRINFCFWAMSDFFGDFPLKISKDIAEKIRKNEKSITISVTYKMVSFGPWQWDENIKKNKYPGPNFRREKIKIQVKLDGKVIADDSTTTLDDPKTGARKPAAPKPEMKKKSADEK